MSEQNTPQVRSEEPELSDEALEQVAGGCDINSEQMDQWTRLTLPIEPIYTSQSL